jgi:aspartyl-tRNA(Asn)/glutamyl-tRNA(Gln) amidotransferase subunit C
VRAEAAASRARAKNDTVHGSPARGKQASRNCPNCPAALHNGAASKPLVDRHAIAEIHPARQPKTFPRMSLKPGTLDHLGRLARLALDDATRDALTRDLERTLGLLDALAAIDVTGVEPLAHPFDAPLSLREDRVTAADQADALLALAPESQGGYYVVPQVIE